MPANSTNRRVFLQDASAAALLIGAGSASVHAAPGDKLNVAVIGTGGMGTGHVRALSARTDVNLAWL